MTPTLPLLAGILAHGLPVLSAEYTRFRIFVLRPHPLRRQEAFLSCFAACAKVGTDAKRGAGSECQLLTGSDGELDRVHEVGPKDETTSHGVEWTSAPSLWRCRTIVKKRR